MSEDLARRAVACRHWRWLPGMLGLSAKAGLWRVEQADLTALFGAGAGPASIHEVGVWLPDLSDPCTLGGLLALVREAWGCPHLSVVGTSEDWRIDAEGVVGVRDLHSYKSEAEALVAALEAAP